MAKIVEDVLIIKVSKIIKDNDRDEGELVTPDIRSAIEQVAQELIGDGLIVEVVEAK